MKDPWQNTERGEGSIAAHAQNQFLPQTRFGIAAIEASRDGSILG
jgi:hypothetical protein